MEIGRAPLRTCKNLKQLNLNRLRGANLLRSGAPFHLLLTLLHCRSFYFSMGASVFRVALRHIPSSRAGIHVDAGHLLHDSSMKTSESPPGPRLAVPIFKIKSECFWNSIPETFPGSVDWR